MLVNAKDPKYGAPWMKLLFLFRGLPAERKAVDIDVKASYTAGDVLAARHAQELAQQKMLGPVVEGEIVEEHVA